MLRIASAHKLKIKNKNIKYVKYEAYMYVMIISVNTAISQEQ